MNLKCPGQSAKTICAEELVCPGCNLAVEIFSDETRIRCPGCGRSVEKQKLPSCTDWCSSARQCLGEKRWRELNGR